MHIYEVNNSFIVVMLLECSFCLQSSSRKLSLNETLRQKKGEEMEPNADAEVWDRGTFFL